MITKIRSYQDSWFVKGILVLTALSFMSLFGISGYMGRGGNNRPIVRVDDLVTTQDEITDMFNKKIQTLRYLFGEEVAESESMKNAIMMDIVQTELVNSIMKKTAENNNVSISDELIRKIIYSQPEFMNDSGQFDLNIMRQSLNARNMTENDYIEALRRDIVKQHLVQTPVQSLTLPAFMDKYLAEIDGQRKVFEYVIIEPKKLKTDRKISNEEIEQYYQDFALQFEEPENRDVSFIVFSIDELASKYTPSAQDIENYYQENIEQFVIPEQRNILQMVFDNQDSANQAVAALNTGGDFFKIAKDIANQSRADTELGLVAKDMLLEEVAESVFALKKGQFTQPIESSMGWHVMKVVDITPKKETTLKQATSQIIADIRKDRAYEQATDVVADIEDKLGAGATLEEIAKEHNITINKALGIYENQKVVNVAPKFKNLVSSNDFIETAFSYNEGEISQVMETDDGFTLLKVEKINEAKQKDLATVKPEIEKIWADNEKSAIAQEIVNDVLHDLEDGDSFAEVAKRFNLNLKISAPIKKGDALAGLSQAQQLEIYQEALQNPRVFSGNDKIVIIVPSKIIRNKIQHSNEKLDNLRTNAKSALKQELANELIDAYGSDYKIRVKYKYLGLSD
ncbi:MAG: hypothetical protein E7012_07170 [Alphaproteobacteria bacterium]|nr:hypothetical protein [Alphaproteobacteria bacterium]